MAIHCTRKRASPANDTIKQLVTILRHDFTNELVASLAASPVQSSICLKITAEIGIDPQVANQETGGNTYQSIYLGSITLDQAELNGYLLQQSTTPVATPLLRSHVLTDQPATARGEAAGLSSSTQNTSSGSVARPLPRHHILEPARPLVSEETPSYVKRRKTFGKLTVRGGSCDDSPYDSSESSRTAISTPRQLQIKSREYPQRKKRDDHGVCQLQPSSVEKFIAGVWKQIYSSVELAPMSLDTNHDPIITSSPNYEAFRAINSLCLRITTIARCSHSLETIIQAHWVDCFDHRVKEIGIEKPFLSNTDTKMSALREACTILTWSEKELRNRLAIWRGYKEIKDAGGWACLAFAGSGIYRFCKYREGFAKNLATRLERLRSSLEVAADTLHPEWRKLLGIIGIDSQPMYTGHPHDWVVSDIAQPVTLKSTYTQWDPDFKFSHLADSVLDPAAWGSTDPRIAAVASTAFCIDCGYLQSNNATVNECRCFPELYGCNKAPIPVQIFRTPLGMNNGVIARCRFGRGSAIGEFVGLITKGKGGIDVMQSGSIPNQYQIFQGRMGNYTRFVNHSCAPNSQFQKFYWMGSERIVLVSKGIEAGEEIMVDYSHEYWEGLDKQCLCRELCCRYTRK